MVYRITTAPLIREVLKGHNAAVFAYGATGSGKTHTMLGPCRRKSQSQQFPPMEGGQTLNGYDTQTNNGNENGLMMRAIEDIFHHTEENKEINSYKVCKCCGGRCKEKILLLKAHRGNFHYRSLFLIWRSTMN